MTPYRLSDDERDEAISALADAYVEGRLDEAEFDSRMGAASRASLATDLDPLFADLPARRRTRQLQRQVVVHQQHRPSPGWPVLLLLVVGVIVLTHGWLLIPLTFLAFRVLALGGARGCASSRRARGGRS
jgi:Domain of unknown function (DUF1707)